MFPHPAGVLSEEERLGVDVLELEKEREKELEKEDASCFQ
jgi:hypothetical protein